MRGSPISRSIAEITAELLISIPLPAERDYINNFDDSCFPFLRSLNVKFDKVLNWPFLLY